MSEETNEIKKDDFSSDTQAVGEEVTNHIEENETPSDAQMEFSEYYRKLPVWKQVVLLVLFLGGMTAVIMLINFVVEFGAELIKVLLQR